MTSQNLDYEVQQHSHHVNTHLQFIHTRMLWPSQIIEVDIRVLTARHYTIQGA